MTMETTTGARGMSTTSKVKWVKVKAFIRFSTVEHKQVIYFRRGGRMFKMLDANNIKMMATRVSLQHWIRNISRDIKTTPVFDDEQVLYNGKPVPFPMDTEEVTECHLRTLV
jgi:hypothetical protein